MEHLARLSSNPGVQSTMILSKVDGAIIHSTGQLSSTSSPVIVTPEVGNTVTSVDGARSALLDEKIGYTSQRDDARRSPEEVAKMVFSFVSTASGLAEDLEKGDVVQLLRLRTRTVEIIIVPG